MGSTYNILLIKSKSLIAFVALVVALVCASPSYAQKPLTKPEKPTQTAPVEKSGNTTSKSSSHPQITQGSSSSSMDKQTSVTISDNLVELWTNLKENYDMPSFEQFMKDMSDEKNRHTLYDNLMKDGYTLPSYEKFSRDIGFGKEIN